jgi:Skp family chaperone for outer membrane proteins
MANISETDFKQLQLKSMGFDLLLRKQALNNEIKAVDNELGSIYTGLKQLQDEAQEAVVKESNEKEPLQEEKPIKKSTPKRKTSTKRQDKTVHEIGGNAEKL